ncbi:MAG: YkgJ family cysteine cluster protein [Chitinophagaceae bacterium]|jgi:Fe-S-cluster containining protein|nr:YkgJ family cysteine cluster protein [Chitinophagaceae bacterium]
MRTLPLTNLAEINTLAASKATENDAFRVFLKQANTTEIDLYVTALNESITPTINCLDCGNCCKSLMIVVAENEVAEVSQYLGTDTKNFEEHFVEKGANGMMLLNTIPCHFLKTDNACSIYEHRFNGCKEFPALHIPGFTHRLFTIFMHYDRCPIIYNVVEQLKVKTGFISI